jgi:hypothetical protein
MAGPSSTHVQSYEVLPRARATCPEAAALAAELQSTSADFRRLWAENEVRSHWVGLKRLQHPIAGPLTLEYSTFS